MTRAFGARCLATGIVAVMLFSGAGEAQRGGPVLPDPLTPSAQAEAVAAGGDVVFRAGNDGPAERPNHPPIDQIPAREMPDEATASKRKAPAGPQRMIGRDLATGRTLMGPERGAEALAAAIAQQGGGYVGADSAAGLSDVDRQATMSGSMSTVSVATRATHPWRMNVKLVAREGASFWVCSGTMRDAEVVLTAGHCVFDFGGTGWADEVWVYPGWDGVGPHFAAPDPVMNPYGWASGTQLWAANGWINSGDLEFDLGLVGLTRAVGMLTGWFGWEYGGSCAYWTSEIVNNASYPAESCGGGLHTGRTMYYWSGTFDSCPGGRLQLTTVPGCTNAIWGGMSGSGVYRFVNDNRYVHAITSTSNRSTTAHYSRQTQGWVEGTDNDVIPVIRGAAFDLQPLDMNASTTSVVAGNVLSGLTHLASNPTNSGTGAGNWDFDVYLSTNTDISTADTLLSTQNYNWTFAAMQNVNINMGGVLIPGNTPAGTYYVGVIYHNATDGNTSNNDTDGWDAVQITVTKPDLDMTALTVPANAVPGGVITVSNTVQNIGNGAAGAFRVGLYLSSDATCTTGDTFLGSRNLASLGVGASSAANTNVTIPAGTPLGARFVCGIADDQNAEPESNEGNNTISAGITIVQPNLRITSVAAPALASPGQAITVANTVNNNGTSTAGAFRVGLYLSTDAVCTTADTLIGSRTLAGGLAAGASSAANTSATIPAATPLSNRFVCAIADDLLAVSESSEADNTASDPIQIVSDTPSLNLKVNGLDPTPPVVMTGGPMDLTLTIPATTYSANLSWYWALIYNGALYWVTPTGLSTTPAPFLVSPPVELTDLSILNFGLPPATSVTNAMFLVDGGGTVVASDFITATRP